MHFKPMQATLGKSELYRSKSESKLGLCPCCQKRVDPNSLVQCSYKDLRLVEGIDEPASNDKESKFRYQNGKKKVIEGINVGKPYIFTIYIFQITQNNN